MISASWVGSQTGPTATGSLAVRLLNTTSLASTVSANDLQIMCDGATSSCFVISCSFYFRVSFYLQQMKASVEEVVNRD